MALREAFNRQLDRVVRPEVHLLHRTSALRACAYVGLALGVPLAIALVLYRGFSPWVMAVTILAAMLTFLGLAMATKVVTGEESLTYYHHEIAILVVTTLLLSLLGQPILPYLDATILGIGMVLFCGRIGCLMVGCCYGRPHRWGVCYRKEHANAGFPSYFVGVRLFPIQAVESLLALIIVVVGTTLVLTNHPPGEALAWYIVAYDIGRFCFEFVRGDAVRPYYWGFSQAQWISLILMSVVVWAELSGILVFHAWHVAATVLMLLTMIAVACARRLRKTATFQLLHPRHIKEVAEAIEAVTEHATARKASDLGAGPGDIYMVSTSLGVQISASKVDSATGPLFHYALSYRNGTMTEETAAALAKLVLQLRHPTGSNTFIKGDNGIFHLLMQP